MIGAVARDVEERRAMAEAKLYRGEIEGAVGSLVDAAVAWFEGRGGKKGGCLVSKVSARRDAWS